MKATKTTSIILLIFLVSFSSFGQEKTLQNLRFDVNLNYLNKKRSYAVYSDDKFANSGFFYGLNYGLHYELEKIDIGLEYYSYNHINGTIAYSGFRLTENNKFSIKPNLKLGYTPTLEKIYYGGGLTISYSWIHISYNKILHFKSGESKYHGDGIDVISAGISFKRDMLIKIFTSKKKINSNN